MQHFFAQGDDLKCRSYSSGNRAHLSITWPTTGQCHFKMPPPEAAGGWRFLQDSVISVPGEPCSLLGKAVTPSCGIPVQGIPWNALVVDIDPAMLSCFADSVHLFPLSLLDHAKRIMNINIYDEVFLQGFVSKIQHAETLNSTSVARIQPAWQI